LISWALKEKYEMNSAILSADRAIGPGLNHVELLGMDEKRTNKKKPLIARL
jgi:hypothetical protein